jgi:3'-5' exoribonuclease
MTVREFSAGAQIATVLLVRGIEVRAEGEDVELRLADRTGQVVGRARGALAAQAARLTPSTAVDVAGRVAGVGRQGPIVELDAIAPADAGSFSQADLVDGPPRSVEQMVADLRALVETVRRPHLRILLDRLIGPDAELWPHFRDAPAAKRYHQAYRHGLLEHSLSVAQAVSAVSATFPGIDRDLAVTGALLHDIGKLDAYTADPLAIDLTDAGRLQGEIPLGYYRVRREIEQIEGFPPALAQAVVHIILSHHGALEHGSPVLPATREATLVHFVDNLGGRLGSFDRLEKQLPAGEVWSGYDRVLGGGAYFGARDDDVAPRAA